MPDDMFFEKENMMKRTIALVLTLCLILSVAALAGCGKQPTIVNANSNTDSNVVSDTDATQADAPVASVGALPLTSFTASAGGYDLTFEPIDLGGLAGGESTYDFTGDYYDGKYYLSDKGSKKTYVYAIDGTSATQEAAYDDGVGFEKITVNHNGDILLSQGIFEAYELLDDGTFTELPFRHDLECSKLEDFAVITWVNADPTVIHDGVEGEWVFKNINDDENREGKLSMVFDCEIAGERVLIGGTYMENGEDDYRIGVFDYDGNELAMTDPDDSIGSSALNETKNGIISANVGTIYLHDSDCRPLGRIDDLKTKAGFDSNTVSTFWVKDFAVGDDGEIYMLVYVSKADDTKEALLYRVTGF